MLKPLLLSFYLASFAFAGSQINLQQIQFDPTSESSSYLLKAVTSNQRTWIVSFSQAITENMKKEILKNGFEILSFIPDQALLIRGQRPEGLKFTHQESWVPYQAAWKWAKDLQAPSKMNEQRARIVMVRAHSLQDAKSLELKLDAFNRLFVLNKADRYFVVRGYDADLFKLSGFDEVAHLQNLPDFQTLNIDLGGADSAPAQETRSGYETGTKVMNFDVAWAAGYKGQGQIAAMGDTGLDLGDVNNMHPDFKGAVIKGQNFAPFGRSWEDPMGHGTHVAGSVVSRGTQSQGDFKGGAHEAQFIAHSLWSGMMNNLMVPTKLSDMFQAAVAAGVSVHTNSWGSAKSFGSYDSFARQVDEFSFDNPDLLILFAAGNSGTDMNKDGRIDADSIGSPATSKNTLSVGASENYELQGGIQRKVSELRNAQEVWGAEPIFSSKISDNAEGLAMFSSRGPTDDGRLKPEIVAPGTNILSVRSRHPKAQDLWGRYNEDYIWSGGTSMATPLAAGAAVVTRQILQQKHHIEKPSSSLIKAFMMSTSTDLFPGQYGTGRGQELLTVRPNNDEGFGLVNMQTISQINDVKIVDNRTGLATGETQEVEFNLAQPGAFVVTLVWNDAAGSESAGKALVNNLDLEVAGPETQFASNDSTNNFEHFEKNAKAGLYKVKVIGRQIPQGHSGKQSFSLVIRSQN